MSGPNQRSVRLSAPASLHLRALAAAHGTSLGKTIGDVFAAHAAAAAEGAPRLTTFHLAAEAIEEIDRAAAALRCSRSRYVELLLATEAVAASPGVGEGEPFLGMIVERGDHRVLHLEVPAKHLVRIVSPSDAVIAAPAAERRQALDRDHARRIAAYLVRRGGGAVMGPLTLAAPADALAIRPAPGHRGLVRASVRPGGEAKVSILDGQHRRRAIENVLLGDRKDFPSGAAYSRARLDEATAAMRERTIPLDIYLDVDEQTARRIFREFGGMPPPAADEG